MSENYKYLGISDETLERRITEAIAGLALTREDRIPRIFTIVKEVEWDNDPDVDINEIFVEIVPWFTGEDEDSGDPNDDSIAIHCDEITTVDTFGEMKVTIHEFIRSMNNEIHDMGPDYSDRTEPCLSLAEIEKALLDRYGTMTERERKARLDMENFYYDYDPYGYLNDCGNDIEANAMEMTLEERRDILQELLEEMEEEADIKEVTNLLNEFCNLLEENGK